MMVRASSATIRRRSRLKTGLAVATALVGGYGLMAYIVLPWAWTHYEHQNGLAGLPMVTRTSQDIPADPHRSKTSFAPCTPLAGRRPIRSRSKRAWRLPAASSSIGLTATRR